MMPTGEVATAAALRRAVNAPALRSAAATASRIAARARRCGCPGANDVVLLGTPSSTSVIAPATLRLTEAGRRSRIQHIAHVNTPNAITLTSRKLATAFPVIEYATATASGNAGVSLSTAEPACTL